MYGDIKKNLQKQLKEIKEAGLYKTERIITTSQDVVVKVSTGEEVINFCANNYLGLSNNKEVIQDLFLYEHTAMIYKSHNRSYEV